MSISNLPPTASAPAATTASTGAAAPPSPTSGSITPDLYAGATPYVAQILQAASTLSDSSTAPIQDKLNAWTAIFNAVTASSSAGGPSDNAWYTQSTQAQRDVVNNIYANSQVSQQIWTASSQFSQASGAISRASPDGVGRGAQSQLARLNALSPLQQQLVFTGTATYANSLDDWKTALAQEPGASASNSTSTPAVSVSLSSAAQAALAQSATNLSGSPKPGAASSGPEGATDASQALTTLTSGPPSDTVAAAALTVLTRAESAISSQNGKVAATAVATASATAGPNKPYSTGSTVDTSA